MGRTDIFLTNRGRVGRGKELLVAEHFAAGFLLERREDDVNVEV